MKRLIPYLCATAILAAAAFFTGRIAAEGPQNQGPLASSFTYQGRLSDNSTPINDSCDLEFDLWDDLTAGAQVGSTQSVANVPVTEGLFTAALNSGDEFGSTPFNGEARWLEIAVRCPAGSGSYTTLSPRQPLTAAPYAHYSEASSWGGLLGVPAGFSDDVDNDTTYSAGNGLTLNGTSFEAIGSPIGNIVVVAKSGGDYTTIGSALSSIVDASETNRYQIFVGPGDYAEIVNMKQYVDIVGSGPNTTRLLHNGGSSNQVVNTASNAELRDLTVENDGSGSSSFGLAINSSGVDIAITNVVAKSYGSSFNYAIYFTNNATGVLRNVTSTATDGSSAVGMYLFSSDITVYDSSFTGNDDVNGNGVYMTHGGSVDFRLKLINSSVHSTHKILRVSSRYTVLVANSELGGGGAIDNIGGTTNCVASRDDNDAALNANCAATRAPNATGGAFALTCSATNSELTRVTQTTEAEEITVEDGVAPGRCELDFGFNLDNFLWSVSSASDSEPRLVSCQQIEATKLSCIQSTLDGAGVDGPIIVVLH